MVSPDSNFFFTSSNYEISRLIIIINNLKNKLADPNSWDKFVGYIL